jgi:hypothetical protein
VVLPSKCKGKERELDEVIDYGDNNVVVLSDDEMEEVTMAVEASKRATIRGKAGESSGGVIHATEDDDDDDQEEPIIDLGRRRSQRRGIAGGNVATAVSDTGSTHEEETEVVRVNW